MFSKMIQRQLSFGEAITVCLKEKYCDFNGRASRSEYWWFALFCFLLNAIVGAIFPPAQDGAPSIISSVLSLALLLPQLGVGARRLHDTGRSGWWLLLSFLPVIGWIILIVWFVQASTPADNQYGPEPYTVG